MKPEELVYLKVKVDSRARVSLKKLAKELSTHYKAYESNGNIILEPIKDEEDPQDWLFKPKNKAILKDVKKALKQKGTVRRGSFAKYLKD